MRTKCGCLSIFLVLLFILSLVAMNKAASMYASFGLVLPVAVAISLERDLADTTRVVSSAPLPTPSENHLPMAKRYVRPVEATQTDLTRVVAYERFEADWREASGALTLPQPISLEPGASLPCVASTTETAALLHQLTEGARAGRRFDEACRLCLANVSLAAQVLAHDRARSGCSLPRLRLALQVLHTALDDLRRVGEASGFTTALLPPTARSRLEQMASLFPLSQRAFERERCVLPSTLQFLEGRGQPAPVAIDGGYLDEAVARVLPSPSLFRRPFRSAAPELAALARANELERVAQGLDRGTPSVSGLLLLLGGSLFDGQRALVPVLVHATCPRNIEGLFEMECRVRSLLHGCYTAWAVVDYRMRQGSWPSSFDDLSPSWHRTLYVDPFTGRPLSYRQEGEDLLLWGEGPVKVPPPGLHLWKITCRAAE